MSTWWLAPSLGQFSSFHHSGVRERVYERQSTLVPELDHWWPFVLPVNGDNLVVILYEHAAIT